MHRDSRRWLCSAALAAIYGLAILIPFRVYWPRIETHLIADHGDALLQHLHCAWQWHALAEGRFGELLRLPTLAPFPNGFAFGEPLVGICAPLAPLFALTGSSAAAYNGAVIASFLLLALGVYLWARDLFSSATAGLAAAMLVVFDAWRMHYLSALNVLSVHFATFALWLLGRWIARGGLAHLIGAALSVHVQLVSAAQGAIVASYVAGVWLGVAWLASGLAISRRRLAEGAAALLFFLVLCAPWISFFAPAFAARSGLRSAAELRAYSETYAGMAHEFGILGWRGGLALCGAGALGFALRRGSWPFARAIDLLGISLGAGLLFVLARGPWSGSEHAPTLLPAYYVEQILPGLDLLRAPIRLAAFTPIALALLGAGAFACLERSRMLGPRAPAWLWRFLPLALSAGWPALDPSMGAPIAERPRERELAERLAELSPSAVILPLPLALSERAGAAVDERVLIHRRRQIGGFASIIPGLFSRAAYSLGSWPRAGNEIARALGATHIVAPEAFGRDREALDRGGIRALATLSGQTLFELLPRSSRSAPDRAVVPRAAAANRWLTAALFGGAERFDARGYFEVPARWRGSDSSEERVSAFAFIDAVVGPKDPIRLQVPTPTRPGHYELAIDFPGFAIAETLEIEDRSTSLEAPLGALKVALSSELAVPTQVRAGAAFQLDAELTLDSGPILLASSRERVPPRCGEAVVWFGFRDERGEISARLSRERAALAFDLVPGETQRVTWSVPTPTRAGRYDLLVSLSAIGEGGGPAQWVLLLADLDIAPD
jgi:hypothetical protein